jgi:hypothetical protein
MTGSVLDGEDVVHEAIVKAIEALSQTGLIAHPEAWLFRIAHNAARFARRSLASILGRAPGHQPGCHETEIRQHYQNGSVRPAMHPCYAIYYTPPPLRHLLKDAGSSYSSRSAFAAFAVEGKVCSLNYHHGDSLRQRSYHSLPKFERYRT